MSRCARSPHTAWHCKRTAMRDDALHNAVLLAAGGSTRLGRSKQLLQRGGEPLVRRAARLAAATGARRVLVIVGAQRDAVAQALHGIHCETLFNPDWQHGLAASLKCAARALASDGAPTLLLGCDQPALELTHLAQLLDAATASRSGCAATRHADALGVPAVVSASLLSQALLLQGDRGLRPHLNAMAPDAIGRLDAPELLFDLDTPDDVAHAVARGWLDPLPDTH